MRLGDEVIRRLDLLDVFLHRRDSVLIQSSRGACLRADITDTTKATLLLLSHLSGYTVTIDAYSTKRASWFPLTGKFRMATYLTIPGSATARELVVDWDGESHGRDNPLDQVLSSYERAIAAGLQPVLEKSSSGTGWHLRLLTEILLPCHVLRQLGRCIASDSTVEVFPKCDSVAMGEFGSAVWLPLWHRAKRGGGYFYTDRLIPHVPSPKYIHLHTEDEVTEAIEQLQGRTYTRRSIQSMVPPKFEGSLPQPVRVFAMECLDIALQKIRAGEGRHEVAVWLAIRLRDNGISEAVAQRFLQSYQREVDAARSHPFPWKEAQSILQHAYKKIPRAMDSSLLVSTHNEAHNHDN